MPALKRFSVSRPDTNTWDFVVEIEDDANGKLRLSATFEDLDQMAAALDEQLNAVVEAAQQLERKTAR
ncbi:MAG: hypothetical protein ABW034_02170 [Steroidobacteraceae bacterium]